MKKLLVLPALLLGLSGTSQASFNKPLHDYCSAVSELAAITLQTRNEISLDWSYVSQVLIEKEVDSTTFNIYRHVYKIPRASSESLMKLQMMGVRMDIYNMCMSGEL